MLACVSGGEVRRGVCAKGECRLVCLCVYARVWVKGNYSITAGGLVHPDSRAKTTGFCFNGSQVAGLIANHWFKDGMMEQ